MACFGLFHRKRRTSSTKRARRPSTTRRPVVDRLRVPGQLPALPPEVVLRIFEFAASDSPTTACVLARLCTQTRDRVRAALYAEPTLTSARQINQFIHTVKRAPLLAALVRGVRIDGAAPRPGRELPARVRRRNPLATRLAKLLEKCPAIEALELRSVILFSLTDFANADRLRHLILIDCLLSDHTTISRSPFFTPIPLLETLTISTCQLDRSTAEQFFHPHVLPSVKALSVASCRLVRLIEETNEWRDQGACLPSALAGQLEALRIACPSLRPEEHERDDIVDPYDLVGQCTSLCSASIPVTALTPHVIDSLSHALRSLDVANPPEDTPDLFEPHLAAAKALSTTFLALATSSTLHSLGSSPSSSPTGRAQALPLASTSPASFSAFSAASSPSTPSAPADLPLGALTRLVLPSSWDATRAEAWTGNGEFAWSVARIVREAGRRGVRVHFGAGEGDEREGSATTGRAELALGRLGREMLRELDWVKREDDSGR
ncbi:uncharacterized protein JCM10292_007240 [Rhodotorula paludigena]|uniref:uncharacterized protein n=1 Tax=Rhodotorula paludigena TaxID=86838 RepID=UPI003177E9CA